MAEVHEVPAGPLVTTEWLAERLGDPRVRIVDIRGKVLPPDAPKPHYFPKREEYEDAHIPGAVFVDWTRDIVDLDDPVPVQIAPPEKFAATMGALGIGDDTLIVAYDDYFSAFAGRLLWALRYYGHDAARVLDGGWKKWVAEGRPVSREEAASPPATFTPRPRPELRRTAEEVTAALQRGAAVIDARQPAEYEGRLSRAARGGHIPGARNLFYRRLAAGEHGAFAPPEALRQGLAEAGLDPAAPPDELVVYCNGGVSATVTMLGLELAGLRGAAVYDGSWNEWGNDLERPVATGLAET
ncbi:MAG TPA: sulfurtransferase [Ardenticatenaceae bacterium]|nr:sulfurtransferase [Ardenticatenaceae bacterium]